MLSSQKEGFSLLYKIRNTLAGTLFFGLSGGFLEMLLFLTDNGGFPSLLILMRLITAGAAVGIGIWLICSLIPSQKFSRAIAGMLLFIMGAITIIYHCCKVFFGTYFQVSFMLNMAGQVAGGFLTETLRTIWNNLWFFPLGLLPFLLFLPLRKLLLPDENPKRLSLWLGLALIASFGCSLAVCHTGDDRSFYTYDFSANNAVPRFGMANSIRLEFQYAIFGTPLPEIHYVPTPTESTTPPTTTTVPVTEDIPAGTSETTETTEVTEPAPIVYEKNVTDIDWDTLDGGYPDMDAYFSSQEPTSQNAYTGMFAGKNLIFITAEAFSTAAIDPERTPTLYQLSTNGFVFQNYYQPGWTQSTTGGEFANMTGIIPTWVGGSTSFQASIHNDMPLAMGWKFREAGYKTLAYHNNSFSYYNRDLTHPNLGYDYYGCGNGLILDDVSTWPLSDLDMMQHTVASYVEEYLATGVPFHAYYMSVSGHANYGFGYNAMSKKNQDVVAELNYPETIQAYLACQMELEYALTYLVDSLTEAGILEDTVIVLSPDHYPYAMTQGCPVDYYAMLTGVNDTENRTSRYRNTLILWCGSMDDPVYVDTPCSSIDIVPTIYNLFGIPYDSRLLFGRDILDDSVAPGQISTAMRIVVFPDYYYGKSWITNAGIYEAAEGKFIPFEGVEVSEDYAKIVASIVSDRWSFARLLIEYDYYHHVYPDWKQT